ncbi:MAG: 3'-5' exonuclease [Candidatus Izemoplasmatales bacterium]|nr:exonuclease domain-containing protein [Candidatus Izemoplasmatales bacterium]MDD3865282.1 exonuclease domain-containing protein [Candidatus Izemoplasmatales bacterium]
MTRYVYGPLHNVFEDIRVISIKIRRRTEYFYMPKGMFSSFMAYFSLGIYVFMTVSEATKRYKGVLVYQVENIEKIMYPNGQNPRIFYDISVIKSGIKNILNAQKHKLFIDFEMSMPPFRNYENFVSEIIQFGMVLTDPNGITIDEQSMFIKPVLYKSISDRTQKFLHISQINIDNGMTYQNFYQHFTNIVRKYQPMVFVWGQNDLIELRKSMRYNVVPDITRRVQFIDLLKLHKTYFGLKNDLGLFNAHRLYSQAELEKQIHDAHEDAVVTKTVFEGFKKVCNDELAVCLPVGNDRSTLQIDKV